MHLISHSAKETMYIGKALAKNLKRGDIICLFGELGSGKTVLTKGIASGLGINNARVNSPSFVLIREYAQGRVPLYHFDLYRLKAQKDILALGYEEYLYGEGIAVIEWADRLKYLLPGEFLKVELFVRGESERRLEFSAVGERYKGMLAKIHESRTFGHIQELIKTEYFKGAG